LPAADLEGDVVDGDLGAVGLAQVLDGDDRGHGRLLQLVVVGRTRAPRRARCASPQSAAHTASARARPAGSGTVSTALPSSTGSTCATSAGTTRTGPAVTGRARVPAHPPQR